jgi:ESS family glutamate:Na+ symporter
VGLCADLRMLKQGGKALAIFLVVLFPYILVQDAVGVVVAKLFDLHPIFGLVGGSITLVGGHGTGAAYAGRFAEVNNLQSVMELSMTAATIGLIVGGIIAGPVAQYLISKYKVRTGAVAGSGSVGQAEAAAPITTVGVIGSLAGIFAAVVAGQWLAANIPTGAITIPSFLWCMITGVAIRNLVPFTGIRCDDRASDLISGVCLSLFLVMTMMALDLVEVALSAGPLLLMIAAQVIFIALYAVYVCFRFMGRDYEAAVTSAAFIGFSMGSTATAMANMQAITGKYGPAPTSYLIVPLAGAFFIDLMNAFLLTLMLALPFMGG